MKYKIHFLRHGLTYALKNRMYYGSTDLPIIEEGVEDIRRYKAEGIYPYPETDQYYTSGMLRANQTFEEIYGDKPFEIIHNLREMEFGIFEMTTYEDIKDSQEFQDWIADPAYTPEGGESNNTYGRRILDGFKELCKKIEASGEEEAVCVCHGGVIGGLLWVMLKDEGKNLYEWIPDPARGYTFFVDGGRVTGYEAI